MENTKIPTEEERTKSLRTALLGMIATHACGCSYCHEAVDSVNKDLAIREDKKKVETS